MNRIFISYSHRGKGLEWKAKLLRAFHVFEQQHLRLNMADIHLDCARPFFPEAPYSWKSPQADLAAAERLANDCGYHNRDQVLADAKQANENSNC